MEVNKTFFKLKNLKDFLKFSTEVRNILLNECIDQGGTDSVILMRRFRMLSQLSQFESDVITKIYNFDNEDFKDIIQPLIDEIQTVVDRSA